MKDHQKQVRKVNLDQRARPAVPHFAPGDNADDGALGVPGADPSNMQRVKKLLNSDPPLGPL